MRVGIYSLLDSCIDELQVVARLSSYVTLAYAIHVPGPRSRRFEVLYPRKLLINSGLIVSGELWRRAAGTLKRKPEPPLIVGDGYSAFIPEQFIVPFGALPFKSALNLIPVKQ